MWYSDTPAVISLLITFKAVPHLGSKSCITEMGMPQPEKGHVFGNKLPLNAQPNLQHLLDSIFCRFIIDGFHLSSQSISQGATISICCQCALVMNYLWEILSVTQQWHSKCHCGVFSSVSAIFCPGLERMVLNPSSHQCLEDMLKGAIGTLTTTIYALFRPLPFVCLCICLSLLGLHKGKVEYLSTKEGSLCCLFVLFIMLRSVKPHSTSCCTLGPIGNPSRTQLVL